MRLHLSFFTCVRILLSLIILSFAVPTYADIKKILLIDSELAEPYNQARVAMLKEMERQGFIPEENLQVTHFSIDNNIGIGIRLLRAEAEKHDVIFTNGTMASIAAHEFGFAHPKHKFVFCSVTDPIGLGLITQFNQPTTSNFAGVAYGIPVQERLRFLRLVLPSAKTLAMIHSDLPQSKSYVSWLKQELRQPEFIDLKIIFVEVPYVRGKNGPKRMSRLIEKHVVELSPIVDVFLTPSDQLGTKPEYVDTFLNHSDKPLMALTEQELSSGWGAHFGAYPSQDKAGQIAAKMIIHLINGHPIEHLEPTFSDVEFGIHKPYSDQIGIRIPRQLWQKHLVNIFHNQN
ncbi:MAG: ABC transporter substrate-binding protein [Neptuniibacter sp.]